MVWSVETIAVGRLAFKDGVSKARMREVLQAIENLLGCKLIRDEVWKDWWKIKDWCHCMHPDTIERLKLDIEKYKDVIRKFEVNFYRVDKPHWQVML